MKADLNPQKPFVQVVASGGSGCRFYRDAGLLLELVRRHWPPLYRSAFAIDGAGHP